MTALVFLDTETTGLDLTDDIWEFAAIRCNPDGTSESLHLFIQHDTAKCAKLPASFFGDHMARWPHGFAPVEPSHAAELIVDILRREDGQRVHVVGAVPNFDTERLALLLTRHGHSPQWHHHLIDVENLAVGWLAGCGEPLPPLPWNSDDLSRAIGINPDDYRRHEAMADVEWARDIYDRVMNGGAS
jgi:hypothetical protein